MPAISVAFAHDLAGFNGGEGCWMRPAPCEDVEAADDGLHRDPGAACHLLQRDVVRAMLASIQAAGWTSLTQTLGG